MAKVYHNGAWEDCVPRVLGYGTDTFTSLPAMIYHNLNTPLDYQIYGNTGGVGDRTVNRFDYRDYVAGCYISSSGVETEGVQDPAYEATWLNHSNYISISPDESYTISAHHQNMNTQQTVAIAWYDENKIFILRDSTLIPRKNAGSYSFIATAPQNAKFAIFNFFTDNVQKVMFVPSTTPPEAFVPFGYEVDMSVSDGTNTTTTPIYIGDDPLDEDEYVDYQAQKVYRMINGTLTPTDPPVPLPALPTFSGNTVIDCNGIPKPSSVVATYTGWHEQSELIRRNGDWTTPNVQQLSALQSPPLSFTPIEKMRIQKR